MSNWKNKQKKCNNNSIKILLTIIGLTSGFIQLFFGHAEVYTISMLTISSFLISSILFIKTERKLYKILMLILRS